MKTRIKLYVSAVNTNYMGEHIENQSVIHLNAAYSPDPNSENHSFWKATPSGKFRFIRIGQHDFVPGAQYYVDIEPREDGSVGLISREQFDDFIQVALSSPHFRMENGCARYNVDYEYMEMTITNINAWSIFDHKNFCMHIHKI